jgi:hypothetical protein
MSTPLCGIKRKEALREETAAGHRYRWEDNIKANLRETGCEHMDWIQLAQHVIQWWLLVNIMMNLRAS